MNAVPIREKFRPSCFERDLKEICKKFKKSEKTILLEFGEIIKKPKGDTIPGFSPLNLVKVRLPIAEYNIGKSHGLRIIYLINKDSNYIIFLSIYYKGDFRKESQVREKLKTDLKEILDDPRYFEKD